MNIEACWRASSHVAGLLSKSSSRRRDSCHMVHAQQYQKQQGNSTAIFTRSCKFGAFNPQRSTLLIDRQQRLFIARFSSTTVDRYSLTTVDRRHSSPVDRHPLSDINRYLNPDIDRY
ncbi:hypothetical protein F2Q70_00021880 [Brassica cretica]|uniref:Uncharacterized protein n=1 Tax=Brassica cretica TaxID=69181 RepID=A0A8S9GH41_BRACR|nr:hypothetical protein F2Q70_00021880 [Brassica cretica]